MTLRRVVVKITSETNALYKRVRAPHSQCIKPGSGLTIVKQGYSVRGCPRVPCLWNFCRNYNESLHHVVVIIKLFSNKKPLLFKNLRKIMNLLSKLGQS